MTSKRKVSEIPMSNKLITYDKAKQEIERLQEYVRLIDEYKDDTLDKWIIKQYAMTNSIKKIIDIAAEKGITVNGDPLDREYITSVINPNGRVTDELQRILRLGYRQRVKPNKKTKWTY